MEIESSPSALHLRDICRQTKINKTTAYRFLSQLHREGYLFRDEAGNYSFGLKLLQLGTHIDHRVALQEIARPVLRELWKATQETVNFAILHEGMALYLDVFESPHVFRLASQIGMRRPVSSTALGKAILAFLPADQRQHVMNSQIFESLTPHTITNKAQLEKELERVRHQGYALDNEENLLGARCVAAPGFNNLQEAVASISVAGPTTRISLERVDELAVEVKKACHAISRAISGSVGPSNLKRKTHTADPR